MIPGNAKCVRSERRRLFAFQCSKAGVEGGSCNGIVHPKRRVRYTWSRRMDWRRGNAVRGTVKKLGIVNIIAETRETMSGTINFYGSIRHHPRHGPQKNHRMNLSFRVISTSRTLPSQKRRNRDNSSMSPPTSQRLQELLSEPVPWEV